jgi:single-strand DNA-binding protein
MNVAVIRGRLSRPSEERVLPSGDRMVTYEVTVPGEGDRQAESVPVVWFDAPASACGMDVDTEVVAVGRVRRRFFKAGGATASRTEVVADAVVRARQGKRVVAALETALSSLEEAQLAAAS